MSFDSLLGIIGVILGIAGIFTGYIFYVRGRKIKEPYWTINTINLIEGYKSMFRDLEMRYKGNEIQSLSVSKIAFWNNGQETIDRSDVAAMEPLYIHYHDQLGIKILEANVLQFTTQANNFIVSISGDGKSIPFSFDYLDYKDGAVIQIVYSGTSPPDFHLHGKIKGTRELMYKKPYGDFIDRFFIGLLGVLVTVLSLILIFTGILIFIVPQEDKIVYLLYMIISIFVLLFSFFVLWLYLRDIARLPKGLSI